MIESQDLELLMAVVRSGTLRGASELIHLTQPAITRRIQALEGRMGVRLFGRAGRR
ncbi:MAG: LysR family transcriptional regulator, partial [Chloroflexi bacterium]|nr:LysR family transcriptional regulator [Chloroflexota bacterium]